MTLTTFVRKNAFRNLRRSILTVLSIGFSLLLLTFMITVWRSFYIDKGTAQSAQRLVTRHKVSLAFTMPAFYRDKIRAVRGVTAIVPVNWFGGIYKENKPKYFFAQFGTDPDEFFKVYPDFAMPADQISAWQKDRTGVVVNGDLADKFGWKIGDRIVLKGNIFPVDLELTVRGIFTSTNGFQAIYFNQKYVEEAVPYMKGQHGVYEIMVDSPGHMTEVANQINDLFRNSPQPTKTETEKAYQASFLAMMGNVKAFILGITLAVVFATLLVSANTMAMSIRERTREVAVLKTLGFARKTILGLFVGEAVTLALVGGVAGSLAATVLGMVLSKAGGLFAALRVPVPTMLFAWAVAAMVGFLSAIVPSYNASRIGIVDGLRHIG